MSMPTNENAPTTTTTNRKTRRKSRKTVKVEKVAKVETVPETVEESVPETVKEPVRRVISGVSVQGRYLTIDDENHDTLRFVASVGHQMVDSDNAGLLAFAPRFKVLGKTMARCRRFANIAVAIPGTTRTRKVGAEHSLHIPESVDLPRLIQMFKDSADKQEKKSKRAARRGRSLAQGARAMHAFEKSGGTRAVFIEKTSAFVDQRQDADEQKADIDAGCII